MRKLILFFAVFSMFYSCSSDFENEEKTINIKTRSVIALDSGSNYSGVWADGTNGGSGFGPWSITAIAGSGSAGAFIGDPLSAGITGMSATSFALYANPDVSGALVDAVRPFGSALTTGDTFSVQWGVNWDANGSGEKGIVLYSGGTEGTELVSISMGGTDDININGLLMFDNYGAIPMVINFQLVSSTELRVFATGRDGVETYDNTFTFGSAITPDTVKFYAHDLVADDERQPYFDNLMIVNSTVPGSPTSVSAIAGNAQASVSFSAPSSDGGSAITGYTVTSSPGGLTGTGAASPISVTGLTNGTAYTFTVTATNAIGTG